MSNETPVSKPTADQASWPMLQNFQSEMNRFFDRFNGMPHWHDRQLVPAIDVAETDDAIEVSVDVPGVNQKDLDVSVSHESLVIKGTKSDKREDTSKDWHMVERSFGSFRRVIPLGFTPQNDAIEAKYADGVLSLHIAKPAEAATVNHKIEIKAG
ncbi:MAG: Hsp20/alpha crystallin family protein [Hyphomicrobiales bacterium]|jgi:HSP20 family protein